MDCVLDRLNFHGSKTRLKIGSMGIRKVAYQLVYDRLMGDMAGDGLMSVSVVLPASRPDSASEPALEVSKAPHLGCSQGALS